MPTQFSHMAQPEIHVQFATSPLVGSTPARSFTTLSTNKRQAETEADQTIKAMKLMMTEELRKVEDTLVSEVRSMVQQLQLEVQQDIQAVQRHSQRAYDELTLHIGKLSTNMKELQTEMEAKFDIQEKVIADLTGKSVPLRNTLPPLSVTSPAPATVVKSDHIKLTFPTFGRPADDPDPVLYITHCQDFLAVHTLTNTAILASFSFIWHCL